VLELALAIPGRPLLIANYFVLTFAELLIVPVSMSMTTALSTSKTLSTMMGGYYFVMGLGSWISGFRPSPIALILLAVGAGALGSLLSRRRFRLSASYPVLEPPRNT
jgi:hypothetical protein